MFNISFKIYSNNKLEGKKTQILCVANSDMYKNKCSCHNNLIVFIENIWYPRIMLSKLIVRISISLYFMYFWLKDEEGEELKQNKKYISDFLLVLDQLSAWSRTSFLVFAATIPVTIPKHSVEPLGVTWSVWGTHP